MTIEEDDTSLRNICLKILATNPDIVAKYRTGKTAVKGILVGKVIRQIHGEIDVKQLNILLDKLLKE
jgi:aspartyl-tRNA(Asn)/glutamyl-tRNA(Gln) amidotransferase subunit B